MKNMFRSVAIRREEKGKSEKFQEGEKVGGVTEMNTSGIIAIVVAILSLEVGLNTLIKASIRQGMSNFVFIVYAHVVASLVLLPITFIYHKFTRPSPKLTFPILWNIFLLAIFALATQICTYVGIGYSSPTMSAAISNLTPGFTFLIAIFIGMEKLDLKSYSSQAKWIGTIVSITGVFVINFYKGPPIIVQNNALNDHNLLHPILSNWIFGGFLFTLSSFLYALLYIVLARIMKDYPSELMITTIVAIFVAIQSTFVALIVERDLSAWKLGFNLELITICYSREYIDMLIKRNPSIHFGTEGVILDYLLSLGLMLLTIFLGYLQGIMVHCLRTIAYVWVVGLKGPVFITSFKPLEMIVAVFLGVTFLGDTVFIGSVIGGGIIAAGFYSVMWGKANEEKNDNTSESRSYSSSDKAPFLQDKSTDV